MMRHKVKKKIERKNACFSGCWRAWARDGEINCDQYSGWLFLIQFDGLNSLSPLVDPSATGRRV